MQGVDALQPVESGLRGSGDGHRSASGRSRGAAPALLSAGLRPQLRRRNLVGLAHALTLPLLYAALGRLQRLVRENPAAELGEAARAQCGALAGFAGFAGSIRPYRYGFVNQVKASEARLTWSSFFVRNFLWPGMAKTYTKGITRE